MLLLIFICTGHDVKTFDHLMMHLQRPGAIFDVDNANGHRSIESQIFAIFMTNLALINQNDQNVKRSSFSITKTIGIVINGNELGHLMPSQLLKVEKLFVQVFKVSESHCEISCTNR